MESEGRRIETHLSKVLSVCMRECVHLSACMYACSAEAVCDPP